MKGEHLGPGHEDRILRPNFLFEFVKDRGALAGVPLHETALNLLASGAAAAALAGPAVAVEAAAGAVGSGSVLTACVRVGRRASREAREAHR